MNSRAFFMYGTVAMLGMAIGIAIGPILSGLLALGLIVLVAASGITLVYIVLDVITRVLGGGVQRLAQVIAPAARRGLERPVAE